MCEPQWAIAYHSNSQRGRRWYRIVRLIYVDGQWFELYWHPENVTLSNKSLTGTRQAAKAAGIKLIPGIWRQASYGNAMERV